jgi:hypothetical protein
MSVLCCTDCSGSTCQNIDRSSEGVQNESRADSDYRRGCVFAWWRRLVLAARARLTRHAPEPKIAATSPKSGLAAWGVASVRRHEPWMSALACWRQPRIAPGGRRTLADSHARLQHLRHREYESREMVVEVRIHFHPPRSLKCRETLDLWS